MSNAIVKAIEGNDVKSGSAILYCNVFGSGQILSGASISYDDFDTRLEGRIANQPGYYIYPQTRQVTCTLSKGDTWDNIETPIFQAPKDYNIRLSRADATVMGTDTPSLSFNIEKRSATGINNSGTPLWDTDIVADADGVSSTSFDAGDIDANSYLIFIPSSGAESGTVNNISLTLYFDRIR